MYELSGSIVYNQNNRINLIVAGFTAQTQINFNLVLRAVD